VASNKKIIPFYYPTTIAFMTIDQIRKEEKKQNAQF